jgi:spore maturation protein CgeB
MRFVFFSHSLISDWNNGNAHFLRGIIMELINSGHTVICYEPEDSWSLNNLRTFYGEKPIQDFHEHFPLLVTYQYNLTEMKLDTILNDVDVVIVHEWNNPELVKNIGLHRKTNGSYKLFFHDTHHRAVTDAKEIEAFDLKYYDGVLVFGNVLRQIYIENGFAKDVWVLHEAADTRIFYPIKNKKDGDVVWIGNWGDDERSHEIAEFLIEPVKSSKLTTNVFGVRYPQHVVNQLSVNGIKYCGWLPNYKVPEVFSRYRVTLHIPRRPYVEILPGIPTIRVFEALACGIPLICSPWYDTEQLFTQGKDYLVAYNGNEMKNLLKEVINNESFAQSLSVHGQNTILKKHTCAHRVKELLEICDKIDHKNIKGETCTV